MSDTHDFFALAIFSIALAKNIIDLKIILNLEKNAYSERNAYWVLSVAKIMTILFVRVLQETEVALPKYL